MYDDDFEYADEPDDLEEFGRNESFQDMMAERRDEAEDPCDDDLDDAADLDPE